MPSPASDHAGSSADAPESFGATVRSAASGVLRRVKVLAGILVIMWGIEIVDTVLLGSWLQGFGIRPRTLDGLWGVLASPWLHGGWDHIIANSVPLLALGALVALRGVKALAGISTVIIIVGGLLTWIFARGANHIGASGLIFGWLGFLLSVGLFERRIWSVILGLAVAAAYGGMLYGVLPGEAGVSWEGHLFGVAGGVVAARLVGEKTKQISQSAG